MKIAFTSQGDHWDSLIDARFGRAANIFVYDDSNENIEVFDNSANVAEAHGAGTATAKKVYDIHPDAIITGNGPGETALKVLNQLKISIYIDAHQMTLRQAYAAFLSGKLKEM
jgi:predicted Fe-Mo cluster-binding NifX family protein